MKINYEQRFWEIDFVRGIAIIMMILFHLLYDLNFFNIYKINLYSGYFLLFAYIGGTIFISLVGISLSLSYSRIKRTFSKKQILFKNLLRGLKILGLGMIITLVSWLYLKQGFIIFGVLHCIGLSIILSYPFLRLRYLNLFFGIILILCGVILKNYIFNFYWLIWLGFTPYTFYTVDYYPLLPWFGVVLVGLFLGNTFYPNYKRKIIIKDFSSIAPLRILTFLGRNSLIIYLLHQPILIGILYLFLL